MFCGFFQGYLWNYVINQRNTLTAWQFPEFTHPFLWQRTGGQATILHINVYMYMSTKVWKKIYSTILNQRIVSTGKKLASLYSYFIASKIDSIQNTKDGYEITCIWNSKYNVIVYMIQTNADFICQKHTGFFICWLYCKNLSN